MKLFGNKREKEELARELAAANAKITEMNAQLDAAKTRIAELEKLNSRVVPSLANIIEHFQAEISKLSPFATKPIVYRYRVIICAINDLLIPLATNAGNTDAVETLSKIRDSLPTDFTEILMKRSLFTTDELNFQSYFDAVPGADKIPQWQLDAIKTLKKLKQTELFANKLYQYFGEKCLYAIVDRNNPNFPDVKTWLECILNIGVITTDWLDHVVHGRSQEYCYNYNNIMNDFDNSKTFTNGFQHNNYAESTYASNAVYELIQKLVETVGIDMSKLAILIDNKRITGNFVPDVVQQTAAKAKGNGR